GSPVRAVPELGHRLLDPAARLGVDARAVVHHAGDGLPRHAGATGHHGHGHPPGRPPRGRAPAPGIRQVVPLGHAVVLIPRRAVRVHNSGMLTLPRPSTYHVDVNIEEPPELRTEELGAGVVKRATRLADGRELIYYDDADTTLGAERAV